MTQAIVVPYVCDQNSPSNPLPEIFDIPDEPVERMAMLKELHNKTFDIDDEVTLTYKRVDDPKTHRYYVSYGDITVSHKSECFLYVTFVL